MNRAEAERIALAVNAYRPSWSVARITDFIGQHHKHRPSRDVLIALMWVAADPDNESPGRINTTGPWWKAAEAAYSEQPRRRNTGRTNLGAPNGITDPETIAARAAAARANIRPAPTPKESQ